MRILISLVFLFLTACATLPPPNRIDNVCYIFRQYPDWYAAAQKTQSKWSVPIDVQMAIIHQESKFQGDAKPPFQFFLGIIPLGRPSSAFGYAQALDTTWDLYQRDQGHYFASRQNFKDGVDFIGWYAHSAYQRANIPKNDAYHLYLAYHEGVTGYLNRTYLRKPWLIRVAHKVSAQSAIYRAQLQNCYIRY
jgi:hypothetical protein